MYKGENFLWVDKETFSFNLEKDEFRILQLTDFHLGFGFLSSKKDLMALAAIRKIIEKAKPDLLMLTGDLIFPFFLRAGTSNNEKQARLLMKFLDSFKIPYGIVLGNHDAEMGSKLNREQLGKLFQEGEYSIFSSGSESIFGVGNYFINLMREGKPEMSLVCLDSNMYGDGWFFSGFDCIHKDQINWATEKLNTIKKDNDKLKAMAFFHMPIPEFKEAYEKLKLGDKSVTYNFGSICEDNEYFGISYRNQGFFEEILKNNIIKYIFCGHDHLNTLSLTYKGVTMTYGMSIDYLGYSNIHKKYTQRGGTLIVVQKDGSVDLSPVPLSTVVSSRVRGMKKGCDNNEL